LLAGFDPLLDEGQAYVDKLRTQGVNVELEHCPGLTHDLLRLASVMPDVLSVHERLSRALGRHLG
jgi:acetyl esterase